jgi:2-dehydropantoate 2-reductase
MRFAVVGAGSVGCYFGGMLARHGHEGILIGRAHHVTAIRKGGLRMQTRSFDERTQIDASVCVEDASTADVVFLCVKSGDTVGITEELRRSLPEHVVVVSLQNGIENVETLRRRLRNPVIASAVYVASEMAGPGHLRHHGRGDLVIENTAESEGIANMLTRAAIPTRISKDVKTVLWEKLALNCAYNAISAIVQLPLGEMPCREVVRETMRAVVQECMAVARAEGVEFGRNPREFVAHIEATIPSGQYSSTAQDLARGKRSEIEFLNGTIVRRGAANGIGTPANLALYTIVKMLEEKTIRELVGSE